MLLFGFECKFKNSIFEGMMMKEQANREYVINWIISKPLFYQSLSLSPNHPIYTSPKKSSIVLKKPAIPFIKILNQLNKYLINKLTQHVSLKIKLQKIGTIFLSSKNELSVLPQFQFLSKFAISGTQLFQQKINGEVCSQQFYEAVDLTSCEDANINFSQIGNKLMISGQIVKVTVFNFIKAALDIATQDPLRQITINLGILVISIKNRKVQISQLIFPKQKKDIKSSLSRFQKPINQSLYQQRWNDSLMGCLYQDLNIREIKSNLDKGQKLTYRYLQHIKEIPIQQ